LPGWEEVDVQDFFQELMVTANLENIGKA